MHERNPPIRCGDVIVLPIEHAPVVLAMLREPSSRPHGVAARSTTPGAELFVRLVEEGAKDHQLRRLRATSEVVARSETTPRSVPEHRTWTEELSVAESAAIAGVSPAHMRAMAAGGQVRAHKTTSRRRGDRATQARWALCAADVRKYAAGRREEHR